MLSRLSGLSDIHTTRCSVVLSDNWDNWDNTGRWSDGKDVMLCTLSKGILQKKLHNYIIVAND